MATAKYTVPNWAQEIIARAVGLDPSNVAVGHENDRYITFLQYMPHKEFLVCKQDGVVIPS